MAELKKYKYDWFKIIICAVALCVLMVLMFNVYKGDVADNIKELTAENKTPNLVWLIEHVSAAMPVFMVAVVLSIFYFEKSKYVPVVTQREKLIVCLTVAVFTFVGLLGYVLMNSGEQIDPESGEKIKTLWDNTAVWFFAQILPFIILISYHVIRAQSEAKELLAEEETEE